MKSNRVVSGEFRTQEGLASEVLTKRPVPAVFGVDSRRGSSAAFSRRVPGWVKPGANPKLHKLGLESTRCVSVDVFDTLLYRRPVSERRRFFQAATAFVCTCPIEPKPSVESVWAARNEANRWAYHAIDTLNHDAEVKLVDVFQHQLLILGLPQSLIPCLMKAEIETEKSVLVPNRPLVEWLRRQRSSQRAVIGISDTSMSSVVLQEIIDEVAGPGVIDRLYTSADLGLSKRNGGIFQAVSTLENTLVSDMVHLGDNMHADVVQAKAAGARATHLARPWGFHALRRFDGVRFEIWRWARLPRTVLKVPFSSVHMNSNKQVFGRRVLGPIFARYCLRLWLYLSFANQPTNDAVALFCARGGLQLRVIFEAFLNRLDLPLDVPRRDLMISRLVAVRAALLERSPAAFDEIAREFRDSSMASVARAIAQTEIEFECEWNVAFDSQGFLNLVESTKAGREFQRSIADQNALFTTHLEGLASNKARLILCDTGLFGSTLRMLQGGFPGRQWECMLFARCNYKGFTSEHFAQTRGLVSECNMYNPIQAASTILRYWQLFEHILEPDVESVRTFSQNADRIVVANLQSDGWEQQMESTQSPFLQGILEYLTELPRENWFEKVCGEEPACWRSLKKAILFPSRADLQILDIGERSHDFGRMDKYLTLQQGRGSSLREKLKDIHQARWKEGSVTQTLPTIRIWVQAIIESFYILRWVRSRVSLMSVWSKA